jgi:mRNA interferase YafQ
MKEPAFTTQFEKDIRIAEKRGKDTRFIKAVMFDLICENPLPEKYRDHALHGKYKGHRECHIEPDWLLIYMYQGKEVKFARNGAHADLFE